MGNFYHSVVQYVLPPSMDLVNHGNSSCGARSNWLCKEPTAKCVNGVTVYVYVAQSDMIILGSYYGTFDVILWMGLLNKLNFCLLCCVLLL